LSDKFSSNANAAFPASIYTASKCENNCKFTGNLIRPKQHHIFILANTLQVILQALLKSVCRDISSTKSWSMTKKEERRNYFTSLRIAVSIITADLNTI
jgi:hypothetical protein